MADTSGSGPAKVPAKATAGQGGQGSGAEQPAMPKDNVPAPPQQDVAEFLAKMMLSAQSKNYKDYFACVKLKKIGPDFPQLYVMPSHHHQGRRGGRKRLEA